MKPFEVTILGCASAKPSKLHCPSCQVVNYEGTQIMFDCGEGSQTQLARAGISPIRLNHIFISHTHGDHIFGLYGLLSTMNLNCRTTDLHLYVPKGTEEHFASEFRFHNPLMGYKVVFHPLDTTIAKVIYEDKNITVETIPLEHRCPCCGFLIREKDQSPHIDKGACDHYGIPSKELRFIKEGRDYVTAHGEVIPNSALTTPGEKGRSYAYCCDTAPIPQLKEQLQDVTLLCHEATYSCEEYAQTAAERGHSTAADAAQMAKLYGAKQLLITHFSTIYDNEEYRLLDQAQNIFPNTILAQELLKVKIE